MRVFNQTPFGNVPWRFCTSLSLHSVPSGWFHQPTSKKAPLAGANGVQFTYCLACVGRAMRFQRGGIFLGDSPLNRTAKALR
jgi:hypothetical protein